MLGLDCRSPHVSRLSHRAFTPLQSNPTQSKRPPAQTNPNKYTPPPQNVHITTPWRACMDAHPATETTSTRRAMNLPAHSHLRPRTCIIARSQDKVDYLRNYEKPVGKPNREVKSYKYKRGTTGVLACSLSVSVFSMPGSCFAAAKLETFVKVVEWILLNGAHRTRLFIDRHHALESHNSHTRIHAQKHAHTLTLPQQPTTAVLTESMVYFNEDAQKTQSTTAMEE